MRLTSYYSSSPNVSLPLRIRPGWFRQSSTSLTWTTSSTLEPRPIWKEVRYPCGAAGGSSEEHLNQCVSIANVQNCGGKTIKLNTNNLCFSIAQSGCFYARNRTQINRVLSWTTEFVSLSFCYYSYRLFTLVTLVMFSVPFEMTIKRHRFIQQVGLARKWIENRILFTGHWSGLVSTL